MGETWQKTALPVELTHWCGTQHLNVLLKTLVLECVKADLLMSFYIAVAIYHMDITIYIYS